MFLNRIYIRKEFKASMSKTWEKYFFENHEFSESSAGNTKIEIMIIMTIKVLRYSSYNRK